MELHQPQDMHSILSLWLYKNGVHVLWIKAISLPRICSLIISSLWINFNFCVNLWLEKDKLHRAKKMPTVLVVRILESLISLLGRVVTAHQYSECQTMAPTCTNSFACVSLSYNFLWFLSMNGKGNEHLFNDILNLEWVDWWFVRVKLSQLSQTLFYFHFL